MRIWKKTAMLLICLCVLNSGCGRYEAEFLSLAEAGEEEKASDGGRGDAAGSGNTGETGVTADSGKPGEAGETGDSAGSRKTEETGENADGGKAETPGESAGGGNAGGTGETGDSAGSRKTEETGENADGGKAGTPGESAGGGKAGTSGENAGSPDAGAAEASGEEKDADSAEGLSAAVPSPPEEIYVDVCGAVAHPGVYRLPAGSRIFQAVEMAGGLLAEAAGEYVNQARSLEDGQQIYVPTREETQKGDFSAPEGRETVSAGGNPSENGGPENGENAPAEGDADLSAGGGRINLNTARLEDLTSLTGIGESKAQAILAYREEHGGFSSVEEICQVPGIKEGTFLKIKDKIAVE